MDDQQKKRDESNYNPTFDTNNNHGGPPLHHRPLPPNQSPAHGFGPPTMGYPPPQMMYHNGGQNPGGGGCPPPPSPYPPPPLGYNHYSPYIQLPPAAAYNYNPAVHHDEFTRLARCVLTTIIVLVLLSLLGAVLTAVFIQPAVYPVLKVDNMSVTDFKTSTPFTAKWKSNITVKNPNRREKIYFDTINADMIYYYNEEIPVGRSFLSPTAIDTEGNTTMTSVISAREMVPIWVTEKMREDHAAGSVTFSMVLDIAANYKNSHSNDQNKVDLIVLCDKLKVSFVGNSGNGTLVPGDHECKVSML